MNTIMQFLADNPITDVTRDIRISGRLENYKMRVKALTGRQYNDFQTICLENNTSSKKRRFNTRKFQELIVTTCLMEPNLRDVEFLKALNVATPEEALYKSFLAGEISQISEAILQVSGFSEEIEVLEDEVKNS